MTKRDQSAGALLRHPMPPGRHRDQRSLAIVLVTLSVAFAPLARATDDSSAPALDTRSALTAFEQIWRLTRDQIFPPELATTRFDSKTYLDLRGRASALDTAAALPGVINPFLDSLGVSHTRLYGRHEPEYAFFRSLFSTRDPQQPPFSHAGFQLLRRADRWWVREAMDGLPADLAGMRRGDALLTLDGEPFDPKRMCDGGERRSGEPHSLRLRRGNRVITVAVPCLWQNPHASMHDAMTNSQRRIALGGLAVGYLRLWTGTGAEGLERFQAAVASLADTDALILDLRGGFGGAWYAHLDPFYPDREGFFSFTVIDRSGRNTYPPEAHETESPYRRPMAVLINEGTRSGKEALAFQFKKSARATLIGTRTRGAFSAGKGLFVDDDGPLVYYLAVAEYRLDDQQIEGVGIAPDIRVPYPVIATAETAQDHATDRGGEDPQLASALKYLAGVLEPESSRADLSREIPTRGMP